MEKQLLSTVEICYHKLEEFEKVLLACLSVRHSDSLPVRTICIVRFGKQIVYWHSVLRGFHKTFTYFCLDPFAPTLNQIPQKMKIYLYKWGKITSILHYRRLPPQKLELLWRISLLILRVPWLSREVTTKEFTRKTPMKWTKTIE